MGFVTYNGVADCSYGVAFYIRKVKYTSETFCEKFQAILDGFPRLQDIHPFRASLRQFWRAWQTADIDSQIRIYSIRFTTPTTSA